jgi:spore coat polysaccharide biosynthesis protein SpsF (cytidylyltransferase family)
MIVVHSYAYVWFAALPYRVTERLLRTHERIHRGSFIHALIRFTRVSARSVTHCTVRYSVDLVLVFHRVLDKTVEAMWSTSGSNVVAQRAVRDLRDRPC